MVRYPLVQADPGSGKTHNLFQTTRFLYANRYDHYCWQRTRQNWGGGWALGVVDGRVYDQRRIERASLCCVNRRIKNKEKRKNMDRRQGFLYILRGVPKITF